MTESAVVLASGGLDSTTLCYDLVRQGVSTIPLFINYGQHCADTELDTLNSVLPLQLKGQLRTVNVADVYQGAKSRLISEANLWEESVEYDSLYLPYRSLLLLTIGAAFAQAHGLPAVYAAFINSNHAQEIDCSLAFFDKLSGLLAGFGGVELRLPYKNLSKAQVGEIAIELGAPLGLTFSCQVSATVPCGACPNCVDRLEALDELSESSGLSQ